MRPPTLNTALVDILLRAYEPCPGFATSCTSMTWSPALGHIPRGFCGATGELGEVALVLVVAEPGNPYDGVSYPSDPREALHATYEHSYECHRDGRDQFHRNIRGILNQCWPSLSFEDHMRRTWITESVLCSAAKEGDAVPMRVERACRAQFLEKQLALFPEATIASLGAKARKRLAGLGVIAAGSVAPPGCNRREARESWQMIVNAVRSRS